jgi:hypothetical protein
MRPSSPEKSNAERQERIVTIPSHAPSSLPLSNMQLVIVCVSVIAGLFILIPAGIVIVHASTTIARLAPILGVAFVLFLLCLMVIGIYAAFGVVRSFLKRQDIQMRTFQTDPGTPNYPAYFKDDGTFSQPQPGVIIQPVPQTYAPHLVYHSPKELPMPSSVPEEKHQEITIPSFAESLERGQIAPGQRDILYGWEMIEQVASGEAILQPIRGGVELRQTMFIVGGMQCGKSTLVANWLAQEAARGDTVFIVIDPHLNIPETSLMARIAPLAYGGYLAVPAAGRDPKEIARVVKALTNEIDARFAGKETRWSGLRITFVVDEALALARMTRMPKHDPVYDELFAMMQSVATETAKAGITGLYLAQLSSKDQMGDIDIRDACPGCVILKTPYQQALNLKLTGEDARAAHFFEKGHGFFIGASGGEPRRFAFGNTTVHDIANLVAHLPGSPLRTERTRIGTHTQMPLGERGFYGDATQVRMQMEAAPQADVHDKVELVLETLDLGITTKDGIIDRVWKVKKGKGKDYQQACIEYEQVMRQLSMLARREMESQASNEHKQSSA